MTNRHLQNWAAAATPVERIADRRRAGPDADPGMSLPVASEAAVYRLKKWRSQAPFYDSTWFERRLERLGVDEAGFVAVLGDPSTVVEPDGGRPQWVERVEAAYSGAAG